MSGLLPRTPTGGQTGSFDNLNVQTLTVSISGFINALTANEMSVGDLDVTSITTGTINGNPNLNLIGTTVSVGGDTIVTRTASQTLTNKTLTTPTINSPVLTNSGNTITLPTVTATLVGRATTDTLTNKTLDSATNTITVTSGSLVADNINNIINQRVKTTNSVTFATVTTQSILVSTTVNDAITVRSSTAQNNQILFQDSGINNQTGIGYDVLNSLHRVWGYTNNPMVFATNNLERLRIPSGGIASDSSITQMLGLNGTTVSYKTINIDQDVRTTASPTFSALSLTNGISMFGGIVSVTRATQTSTGTGTLSFITIPIATQNCYMIQTDLVAYCTAGPDADKSSAQRFLTRAQQVGGAITGGVVVNNFSTQFATALGHTAVGTDIIVQTSGIASDTINWAVVVTVYKL